MLEQLNSIVDWEAFRPTLEIIRQKQRKSNAGRKPFDVVFMFKILVLQSLYNLSDAQLEFQITDRFSFMAFLGLQLNDQVMIWLFRDELTAAKLIEPLRVAQEQRVGVRGVGAGRAVENRPSREGKQEGLPKQSGGIRFWPAALQQKCTQRMRLK